MLTLVLISITILFFVVVLFKRMLNNLLPVPICALCISVAGTWLWMLLLKIFGYSINIPLLAILMGESVTGILYRGVYVVKPKFRITAQLSLLFVLFGTTLVYFLITGVFELAALFILVPVTVFVLFLSLTRSSPHSTSGKQLRKQLEHCCD